MVGRGPDGGYLFQALESRLFHQGDGLNDQVKAGTPCALRARYLGLAQSLMDVSWRVLDAACHMLGGAAPA